METEHNPTYYHTVVLHLDAKMYSRRDLVQRIVQSKAFMDRNFGCVIELNQIAAAASFSKFHFMRLFKSLYGCTPYQYLINVRVRESKVLLSGGLNVLDTSAAVGFESVTSFTALFKKMTGMTPSAFAERMSAKKDSNFKEVHFQWSCHL